MAGLNVRANTALAALAMSRIWHLVLSAGRHIGGQAAIARPLPRRFFWLDLHVVTDVTVLVDAQPIAAESVAGEADDTTGQYTAGQYTLM